VAIALNVGGIAALILAAYYCIHYTKGNPEFTPRTKRRGAVRGAQSMLPALLILLSAWVLADLISALGTGEYLASVVDSLSMPVVSLIPVLLLVAAVMAFATGTSWGACRILWSLAGELMNVWSAASEV